MNEISNPKCHSQKMMWLIHAFVLSCSFITLFSGTSLVLWELKLVESVSGFALFGGFAVIFIDSIIDRAANSTEKHTQLAKLWRKWFVRYPYALLFVAAAIVLFGAWLTGNVSGRAWLLVNPVVAAGLALYGLHKAWELAIAFIVIAVVYFVVIGLVALPVSIAILLGSALIAWAIAKK